MRKIALERSDKYFLTSGAKNQGVKSIKQIWLTTRITVNLAQNS